MMGFYIFGTLMMGFFLLKNIHNEGLYKEYAKEAIFSHADTRPVHKTRLLLFRIAAGCFAVILLLAIFVWHVQEPSTLLSIVCLIVGCILFGFYPFSARRWAITDKGVYVYDYGTFIPWAQMIGVQIVPRGKKTFIVLSLKQQEGEHFKRTAYPLIVPGTKAMDLCNMIRDFISAVDKKRYRKQFNEEHKQKLKNRKFY